MRAVIYYFSGTGNSLAAARQLAEGLGAGAPEPMARFLETGGEVALDADVVGLVYPVHHWGVPDLVLRFARLFRLRTDTYAFAVATYGGRPGRAWHHLDKELKEGGHALDAGFHLKTVQNYVPVFRTQSGRVQRRLQAGARQKVDAIVEAVKGRSGGESEDWPRLYYMRGYYLASRRSVHGKDRHFEVREGCTSCGTCAAVCPVGNIEMEDGKPRWLHRCEQCLACLHWCPEGVIEWGGATRGRGRYHHPDVTLGDMREQAGQR
jgi:ferredoxin